MTLEIQQVVDELESLYQLEREGSEQAAWYGRANALSRAMMAEPALSKIVPEIVWHYLSDRDVRDKDLSYREIQTKEFLKSIDDLKGS